MDNLRRVGLVVSVAITSLCAAHLAAAQPDTLNLGGGSSALCPSAGQYVLERPLVSAGPTEVGVGVFFVDLIALDDVAQSFTADVTLVLRWVDPRLANPARGSSLSVCPLEADQAWMPAVQFQGIRASEKHYEDVTGIDAVGMITHAQRLSVEIAVPLDLRDFPFDRHTLAVELRPVYSGVDEVAFSVLAELSGLDESVSLTGWTLGDTQASIETVHAPRIQVDQSWFRLQVAATRESGFYVWKALTPLMLIIFMSWAVFFIDPKQISSQLGLATTSMLTLIAFQFAFTDLLPRISYFTRADRFILSSSLLVFLALVEAIITSSLARVGRTEMANRLDQTSRFVFPAALVAIVAIAFFL